MASIKCCGGEVSVRQNNDGTRATQELPQAINTSVTNDCSRYHKSFLRQKELRPSPYLRAEATGLLGIWSSCYPFLKKDSKILLLGQRPSVQHFYKGLHWTIHKRSVAFSEKQQHVIREMLLNGLSTEGLSFPHPDLCEE